MEKIVKSDLIDKVTDNVQLERSDVAKVIDSFIVQLKNSMAEGATIELRGLGTFEPRLRKGREVARNPKTGEIVSSKAHYVSVFRAGKELKESLFNLKNIDEK